MPVTNKSTNAKPLDVDKAIDLTVHQLTIQHDTICNAARFGRAVPELVDAYEALTGRYCVLVTYKKTGEWKP